MLKDDFAGVLHSLPKTNNLGEKIQKTPAGTGSLIYYEISPSLRNRLQQKAVEESRLGIPLLFGCTGEILTEKSGNLNLGIPGIMYVGGISGVIGAFLYEGSIPAVS